MQNKRKRYRDIPGSECGHKLHSFCFSEADEQRMRELKALSERFFETYGQGVDHLPMVDERNYYQTTKKND